MSDKKSPADGIWGRLFGANDEFFKQIERHTKSSYNFAKMRRRRKIAARSRRINRHRKGKRKMK